MEPRRTQRSKRNEVIRGQQGALDPDDQGVRTNPLESGCYALVLGGPTPLNRSVQTNERVRSRGVQKGSRERQGDRTQSEPSVWTNQHLVRRAGPHVSYSGVQTVGFNGHLSKGLDPGEMVLTLERVRSRGGRKSLSKGPMALFGWRPINTPIVGQNKGGRAQGIAI